TAHWGVTAITRCGLTANWLSQWDFAGLFAPPGAYCALFPMPGPRSIGYFSGFPRKMFCYFRLAPGLRSGSKIIASSDWQYSSNNCLRAVDLGAARL
ncbi:MAG TPA: hypothetical protein VJP83_07555, partial [Terriglobales bacterium]|nr:hypothetical protein [Terriglobales bacterium]